MDSSCLCRFLYLSCVTATLSVSWVNAFRTADLSIKNFELTLCSLPASFPFSESLLSCQSFPSDRNHVLRRHNEGIARWLNEQHNRRKEVSTRTTIRTGQLSIIGFCGSTESRRQHNNNFQTRLQEARKAILSTIPETSNTSDGDRSPEGHPPEEEPPD